MLEEQAEVTQVDGNLAWVSCRAQLDCVRCAEGRGCGGGILGRWLGDRLHRVRVTHDGGIKVGDCVVIGLDERQLFKGAAMVYGVPLLAMFGGAVGGTILVDGDAAVGFGMVAGLVAGFGWLYWFSRKMRFIRRFQPTVMRRVAAAESR